MPANGLVAEDGGFTLTGRETKQRIESLTDDLEPLAAALVAAQDRG